MKRYIIVLISICILFTACNNKQAVNEVSKIYMDNVDTVNFKDNKKENSLLLDTINIPINKNASVNSLCESNGVIYYSVDFKDYLEEEKNKKRESDLSFNQEYNTEIRSFNLSSQKDKLLYKYNIDYSIEVTDLVCNGEWLVWEEYPQDGNWKINEINTKHMNSESNPKVIITKQDCPNSILDGITLSITQNNLYWYHVIENQEKTQCEVSIQCYDFLKKEISTIMNDKDIYIKSPYEHVNIVNNVICVAKNNNDNENVIHLYDISSNKSFEIIVPMTVIQPISNGSIIVWSDTYDAGANLYVYNMKTHKVSILQDGKATSMFCYNLLNDKIIVYNNQDADGFSNIYYYDMSKNIRSNITNNNNEDTSYGYLYSGLNSYTTWKHMDDKFQVICIK